MATPRTRSNLKEDAAALIREMIFASEFKPGMRVDQDLVADHLGTSKLPVREALILLEGEGLVSNIPRRGAFVANLTAEDIQDSYHAIGQLSAIATARAAVRLTDEDLKRLRELVERMDDHDLSADSYSEFNHEFHRAIHRAGASARLRRALRSLTNAVPDRLHTSIRHHSPEIQAEHWEILQALEHRDPDRAVSATVGHFLSGAKHAIDLLVDRGFWD
ncbi:GntR family transcriptional regulator [Saccharomonospora sp. NPDC046836]|uniref:GntR family transcriptional regulator n=1 Tax=Saccharomonospora sp. NPDC046836 TaxID=3156921 RepID=UPI0033CC1F2D